MTQNQAKLQGTPFTDTVSDINFSLDGTQIVAGGWDCTVHVYEFNDQSGLTKELLCFNEPEKDAITRCIFDKSGNNVFYGTASGQVKSLSIKEKKVTPIGAHAGLISGLKLIEQTGFIVSASIDTLLYVWDPAKPNTPHKNVQLPAKPIQIDISGDVIGVIMLQNNFMLINTSTFTQVNNGPYPNLPAVMSSLAFNQQQNIYLFGCIQGMIQVSTPQIGTQYFMCHRSTTTNGGMFTPNCICISPPYDGMYGAVSGGSDGCIEFLSLHNGRNKSYPVPSKIPVTAIKITQSGNYLIYATGCDWTKGASEYQKSKPPCDIYIRKLAKNDFPFQ